MKKYLFQIWSFGIFVIFLSGCFASKDEKLRMKAMPHYEEALDKFLNGEYPLAKDKILTAIKIYPEFVEGHILYQWILAKIGEGDKLPKQYNELMRKRSDRPEFIFLYARLLDDIDQQENYYKRLIDIAPENPWGYFGLGWVYYKRMRLSDASAQFEKSIEIDSSIALFHLNLGAVYYLMGMNTEAINRFQIASSLNPRMANVWANLSQAYYKRGDFEQASDALERYIRYWTNAPDIFAMQKRLIQLRGR